MTSTAKSRWLASCLLAAAAFVAPAAAQHVISAMAGFIHHVEGRVLLNNRPIAPKPTDFLHVLEGQRLRTDAGRAEILLVPDSYIRLGPQSEMEMINAGLTAARLKLLRGEAVLDLGTIFEKDSIVIATPAAELRAQKPGLYRVLAPAGAPAAVEVFGGRLVVAAGGEERRVKSKQRLALEAPISGQRVEKAEWDESHPLLSWSSARQAELAESVRAARRRAEEEGFGPAERLLLEMTLRRPRPAPRPPSSPAPQSGSNSPR